METKPVVTPSIAPVVGSVVLPAIATQGLPQPSALAAVAAQTVTPPNPVVPPVPPAVVVPTPEVNKTTAPVVDLKELVEQKSQENPVPKKYDPTILAQQMEASREQKLVKKEEQTSPLLQPKDYTKKRETSQEGERTYTQKEVDALLADQKKTMKALEEKKPTWDYGQTKDGKKFIPTPHQ